MIQQWVNGVKTLAVVASRLPQMTYTGMATSLHAKWQYVCRVVPSIAADLAFVNKAIRFNFIPTLLGRSTTMTINENACHLLNHIVKMDGIGI